MKPKHKRLEKLYVRQNGECFYCQRKMLSPTVWRACFSAKLKGRDIPQNLCTIEHLDDRLTTHRGKLRGERTVAACRACNSLVAKKRYDSLPIEEKRARSGHATRFVAS